jgi:hypothetical protein
MNIVIGNQGAVEQPIRHGWSPDRGYFTTREWRGAEAACKAIANQIQVVLGEYELVGGAVWTVTGKFSSPVDGGQGNEELPTSTWEFFAGEVEKDFLAADSSVIDTLGTTDDQRAERVNLIRKAVEDKDETSITAINALGNGAIKQIYQRMTAGHKSLVIIAPSLRKSQLVSSGYLIPSFLVNVGRIYKTDALVASEPTMPLAIQNNIPSYNSSRNGLRTGWYKAHPQIQQVGFNKFQVSQEFRYGLWVTTPEIYTVV